MELGAILLAQHKYEESLETYVHLYQGGYIIYIYICFI